MSTTEFLNKQNIVAAAFFICWQHTNGGRCGPFARHEGIW